MTSEEDVFEAVLRTDQFDKTKRLAALEEILPSVRFPLLSAEYLVEFSILMPFILTHLTDDSIASVVALFSFLSIAHFILDNIN